MIVLFLLGWGADSLSRFGAESLLSRNIQYATGVTERPQVTVRGFAFLPQVISGAYREVDVTIRGVTSGPLRVERVESRLLDVRVPFHDVLVQDVRRVGIGRSIEDVTLTYADLNAYFDKTGRSLQLMYGPDDTVLIDGAVDVLGREVTVQATVDVYASGETLRISPRAFTTGESGLDRASRLLLGQRLTLTVPLGTLPFGHQLTGIEPGPDGLRVTAEGTAIVIEP